MPFHYRLVKGLLSLLPTHQQNPLSGVGLWSSAPVLLWVMGFVFRPACTFQIIIGLFPSPKSQLCLSRIEVFSCCLKTTVLIRCLFCGLSFSFQHLSLILSLNRPTQVLVSSSFFALQTLHLERDWGCFNPSSQVRVVLDIQPFL